MKEETQTEDQKPFEYPRLEAALLGLARLTDGTSVLAYDVEKCIDILEEDMSRADAKEYFDYNIRQAYIGAHGPIFVDRYPLDKIEEMFASES